MILNLRCWQSLDRQHGKGVDGVFAKVSFQTAFEGVELYCCQCLNFQLAGQYCTRPQRKICLFNARGSSSVNGVLQFISFIKFKNKSKCILK